MTTRELVEQITGISKDELLPLLRLIEADSQRTRVRTVRRRHKKRQWWQVVDLDRQEGRK